MSRYFDDEDIASARGCICGGCRDCLRAQGYSEDEPEEVACEKCGDMIPYEERFETQGFVLCEDCAAEQPEEVTQ